MYIREGFKYIKGPTLSFLCNFIPLNSILLYTRLWIRDPSWWTLPYKFH